MHHDPHATTRTLARRTLLRAASGGWIGVIAGVLAGCGRTAPPRAFVPTPAASAASAVTGTRPILITNGPPVGPLAGWTARPVDPLTLTDVPGAAPFSFALHCGIAFGPGGRTLAVSSSPDAFTHTDATLQFIDSPTWTATPTVAIADGFLFGMLFSNDERYLYWLTTTRRDRAHGIPLDFDLVQYDRAHDATRVVTSLPPSFVPDFLPFNARLFNGERKLAIYGVPTDGENLATDAPHLLIVDLHGGTIEADVRLDAVKAGQFAESPNTPTYHRYAPGLAWDLAHDRLYIGHADAERVTVVDLAHGVALSAVDIHPAPAPWQRIAKWLMPSVAAKGGQSNGCTAVLGHDGARLFLAWYGREMEPRPDGTAVAVAALQGVQVVETSGLHLIGTLSIPDGQLVPTPDRRMLLIVVRDAPNEATAGTTQGVPTQLIMFDTQTLGERGRAAVADSASLVGFSADGRIAYLDGMARSPMSHARLLQVFSLDTRQIIAERTLDSGDGSLLLMRDW